MVKFGDLLNKMSFGAIQLPEHVRQGRISKATVDEALGSSPKRICFASTHRNALKAQPGDGFVGSFSLPFVESAYPIFYAMTGLNLFKSKGGSGWWRSVKTAEEYEAIQQWTALTNGVVFLRDTLALSVAIGEHQLQEGGRSYIGDLEYRAKYHQDATAIVELTNLCANTIQRLAFYSGIDAVCAVPPSQGKGFDLPTVIAASLATTLGVPDLTSNYCWKGEKTSLKASPVQEKWSRLEKVGLGWHEEISAKYVLLIDDLYQSGITMQFTAMNILESGAERVYGLSIVKSRRDSDNQ